MKYSKLAMLNFMALCCVLGIFTKKMINPFANIITEALHIPGGVSTAFSIMFLVIASEVVRFSSTEFTERDKRYLGTLMGTVQGFLALALGRVGSMGIFMPLGFMMTGIAIDLVYEAGCLFKFEAKERMIFANVAAAFTASFFANLIVFSLPIQVLGLYLCVSCISGIIFGFLGYTIKQKILCGLLQKE